MGYLAHRGWDCHAINLPGRSPGSPPATGLQDCIDRLREVVHACDAPPVLVGHDLGGLLALERTLEPLRAVVALAPLLPANLRSTPIPGLGGPRARMSMALSDRLPVPRGRLADAYFGETPPHPAVAEPAVIARQLSEPQVQLPLGPQVPTLIVAGEADRITAVETIEDLAHALGAELQRVAGAGHALPWGPGWQERAAEMHRWLIQTLGDSLLALLDEEEPE
jgi:pimeloyl-ACP methyl ester carboxylesterase